LFQFLPESTIFVKIVHALKISFVFTLFTLLLYLDTLQHMFQVTAEFEMANSTGCQGMYDAPQRLTWPLTSRTAYHLSSFRSASDSYIFYHQLTVKHILDRSIPLPFDLTCTWTLLRTQEYVKSKKVASALRCSSGSCSFIIGSRSALAPRGKQTTQLGGKLTASEVKDRDFGVFIVPLSVELNMGPAETLQKQTA
ncbi:hypothetical protein EV702DRAFT_975695, partial [Suillus placidus]